jgi:hypothetical protein
LGIFQKAGLAFLINDRLGASVGVITNESIAFAGLLAGENTIAVRLRNVTLLSGSVLTKCNLDLLIRASFQLAGS